MSIGFKEGAVQSIRTVTDAFRSPSAYLHQPYSINSQLALQVAMGLVDERFRHADHMRYRRLSDVIYFANDYFDIGMAARKQMYQNKQSQFVALDTVHATTWQNMAAAVNRLTEYDATVVPLVESYLNDGQLLAENKDLMDHVLYRELDSGLSAFLTFGVVGGQEYLAELCLDGSRRCETVDDLKSKYSLFLVRDQDVTKLTRPQKLAVGLQSIEMVLACIDDGWGEAEDKYLGISRDGGEDIQTLIEKYRNLAIGCGFSPRMVDAVSLLVQTHKLKLNTLPPERVCEIHEIQHRWQSRHRTLLREWLQGTSLLEEMFR